ncbi:MAG: type II toxin-antitoxin system YafQ family toxin [Fibrobacter sp.]|nr:type II toxin-antitoxin system YafQ family toxin [Fibrobacter sp.]
MGRVGLIQKLKDIVDILAKGEPLPESYKDHPLVGNWVGHRIPARIPICSGINVPAYFGRPGSSGCSRIYSNHDAIIFASASLMGEISIGSHWSGCLGSGFIRYCTRASGFSTYCATLSFMGGAANLRAQRWQPLHSLL